MNTMETININQISRLESALDGISAVSEQAQRSLGCLDDQLLTLQLNFGKLRAAIERAFAPIVAAVAPMLGQAIRALTDFCDDAGAVMAALFGTVYKKAVTTTKSTGSAIRRSLASFDELNRLNGGGGGSGSQTSVTYEPVNDPLTPRLQAIVDQIRSIMAGIQALLAPLQAIDLTPAAAAFAMLGQAIGSFAQMLGEQLSWGWYNLLVPLAQWTIEEAAPAAILALSGALELLTAILEPVLAGIRQLQPALEPVAQFIGDTVIVLLEGLGTRFTELAGLFSEKAPQITGIFTGIRDCITAVWSAIEPALTRLRDFFGQVLQHMSTTADTAIGRLLTLFSGLTEFVAGVLTGNWSRAWEGLKTILTGAVNGIISVINTLLSGLAAGINGVVGVLNRFSVTVPDWVPLLGGRHFGFSLGTVSAPQIPYLAKGAVLPANKPFLAMVGDQRHGTNIEAPLSTIQEAVAGVMQDQTGAILAGFEASLDVQREILQAVLGIRIGDEVIAGACRRYEAGLAMMKGV